MKKFFGKPIAFIVMFLICIVSIYCAGPSFDETSVNVHAGKSADVAIDKMEVSGFDYVVNTNKTEEYSANRMLENSTRLQFLEVLFVLSSIMAIVCVILCQKQHEIVQSVTWLIYYIHNVDGKKEQEAFLTM